MDRIFIFDCDGRIVGNPTGYATYVGASRQTTNRNSKVRAEIWRRFYEREKTDPSHTLVFSIKPKKVQ